MTASILALVLALAAPMEAGAAAKSRSRFRAVSRKSNSQTLQPPAAGVSLRSKPRFLRAQQPRVAAAPAAARAAEPDKALPFREKKAAASMGPWDRIYRGFSNLLAGMSQLLAGNS